MAIIGIDPGITGAIAVIDVDACVVVEDMPIMTKVSGKGNQINSNELYAKLHNLVTAFDVDSVYVERVNAMPGQGVSSVFSFGKSAGIIEGVLASLGVKVFFPTPQKWKKNAGLIGKEKDAARTLAITQFPEIADRLTRKKDGGRADAILIARYGQDD